MNYESLKTPFSACVSIQMETAKTKLKLLQYYNVVLQYDKLVFCFLLHLKVLYRDVESTCRPAQYPHIIYNTPDVKLHESHLFNLEVLIKK